jgi:hypothetical protein
MLAIGQRRSAVPETATVSGTGSAFLTLKMIATTVCFA